MKRTFTAAANATLALSVKTMYEGVYSPTRGLKGFVEIKPAPGAEAEGVSTTYVVVLDKSQSMSTGSRYQNTVQGFRALNEIIKHGQDRIIVIPFNHAVTEIMGPYTSPIQPTVMDDICRNHLRPNGGTNIEEALSKAYMAAEKVVMGGEGVATILLMTDGEDVDTRRRVDLFVLNGGSSELLKSMKNQLSGIFVCIVGICPDADAHLLGTLSEIGNGTYTITKDHDIAGLIGSLVGLMSERSHEKVVLDVWLQTSSSSTTCTTMPIIMLKPVHMSTNGHPLRIPFSVVDLPFKNQEVVELFATAKVFAVGSKENTEEYSTDKMTLRSSTMDADGGGIIMKSDPDLDCVVNDFDRLSIQTRTTLATAIAHCNFTEAEELNTEAMKLFENLKLEFAVVIDKPEVAVSVIKVETELNERARDLREAQTNYQAARSLSHRIASDASTARNSGLSVGGSYESAAQTDMRTRSASLSFNY